VNPVAKRLAVHAAELRRLIAIYRRIALARLRRAEQSFELFEFF
jgi:hypothetical protein